MLDDTPLHAPSHTRRTPSKQLRLTERDIALFQSLAEGGYLTIEALEWLHYPWRERWDTAQQTGQHYKPSRPLCSRLKRMREARLVQQIVRPVALASNYYRRNTDVYVLGREGADVVATATGQQVRAIRVEDIHNRSFNTLSHAADIGTFYAAMRAKVRELGLGFAGWQTDQALARGNYDRIQVRVKATDGSVKQRRLPVLPDGVFWITNKTRRYLFFVELDRGRHVSTWREKIMAYEAYVGSAELTARYGVEDFILLTATTTDGQRQKLIEATAQINRDPGVRYLFTRIADLHPTTIGHAWLRIERATPTTKAVAGRPFVQMTVETAQHTLLKS
ncbi:MAG TPA: replication-relaxation family protein [Herpetosiphonaceae bacterium]